MSDKSAGRKMSTGTTAFAVSGYMACSALMLIVNKLAVHFLPAPSFVLLCQLLSSAIFTKLMGSLGFIEVDNLEWGKIKRFWVVPISFLGTIYANIKILESANVETFIVFRASTPLIISLADYVFLDRELPSRRSVLCLASLLFGSVLYVLNDKFFTVNAYYWVVIWYVVFSFDQIYIKHAVDTVRMTTWGRVYYTNAIGAVPLLVALIFTGDLATLTTFQWTTSSLFWLLVSCSCGVAIAYFAFLARAAISATYFTVIGNTCKVITVLINIAIWDNHATPGGLASLGICLVGAYFYKQAPKRRALPK